MKNTELIYTALNLLNEQLNEQEHNRVKELLEQFLLSNTLQSEKFNPYEYVSKNDWQSAVTGVLYESGQMVATDAHMIIAYKADYNPDLEGKIIDKNGAIIDARYPNWKVVIPDNKNLTFVDFDYSKVFDLYKSFKVRKKIQKEKEYKELVTIEDVYFDLALFYKLAKFCKHFGISKIGISNPSRACKVTNDNATAILMPIISNKNHITHIL